MGCNEADAVRLACPKGKNADDRFKWIFRFVANYVLMMSSAVFINNPGAWIIHEPRLLQRQGSSS